MSTTTEHAIIFNEWSINRILANEKTQTRRVVDFTKFDPLGRMDMNPDKFEFEQLRDGRSAYFREPNGVAAIRCPYGKPGDVLWVREAFRLPVGFDDDSPTEAICTKDCDNEEECNGECHAWKYQADGEIAGPESGLARTIARWGRLRSSIHMPKELCRLRLRVEDVRVERVQEISKEDAIAEGLEKKVVHPKFASDPVYGKEGMCWDLDPRIAFRELWKSIHGENAWARNDWVWVVEYELIHP